VQVTKEFSPERLKSKFPGLVDSELAYLDNAATTHKPDSVIDAIERAYSQQYASVHRGLFAQAEQASELYEESRAILAGFIGAHTRELIFTRSATESINQVAQGWLLPRLKPGDWVWLTRLEHHANYLPWDRVCRQTGAELKIIELTEDHRLDLLQLSQLDDPRSKFLTLTAQSNVTGEVLKLSEILNMANAFGIPTLVDASQLISHQSLDVQTLGTDFMVFSGHKMFGPTGIGVLFAKYSRQTEMEPLLLGGGMVDWVGDAHTPPTWSEAPQCFEAGSPNFAGALGLAAAVKFIQALPAQAFNQHLKHIGINCYQRLSDLPGIIMLTPKSAAGNGIISFAHQQVHPHDLAQVAGDLNVGIRAGHHCAQPLMQSLGLAACARASLSLYNTDSDIDRLVDAVDQATRIFT